MAAKRLGVSLPLDQNSTPVQILGYGAVAADDTDGSSDRVALPTGATEGTIVRIASTTDIYVAFGTSSVTAGASDHLFPSGVEIVQVPDDATHIAYIQVSAAGRISITRMI